MHLKLFTRFNTVIINLHCARPILNIISGSFKIMKTEFRWSNTKVLVTGASGLVGAWLCAVLLELGARVYGTVRNQINLNSAYRAFRLSERIETIHADISD